MADDSAGADAADDEVGLTDRQRAAASLAGLVGLGVGGAGIFLSENQAGTTAILLLGAVFLLMGIQGTAIVKAGTDSVEMARHRKAARVAGRGEEVLEERGVEEARAYVEEVLLDDPRLAREPQLSRLNARLAEEGVLQRVQQLAQSEFSPPLNSSQTLDLMDSK